MLRVLPRSPRSSNNWDCLGKISACPKPMAAATCRSFCCMLNAGTGSNTNKYRCAPPLLERQTTRGSLNFLSLRANDLWSSCSYSSMSMAPHTQQLSSLIGTKPTLCSPLRCFFHKSRSSSRVSRCEIVTFLPLALPSSRRSFVGVNVPYACFSPANRLAKSSSSMSL